jgi:hypothetical protein
MLPPVFDPNEAAEGMKFDSVYVRLHQSDQDN